MTPNRLICIVDDDEDYRFLLQQVFKQYLPIYLVRFYSSGKSLFNELPLLDQLPNLIILDCHMPVLNGHQVLIYLKQDVVYKVIPVVMMSNESCQKEIDGFYEAGVNSFVMKQTDMPSMKETMINICDYWLKLNQEPTY